MPFVNVIIPSSTMRISLQRLRAGEGAFCAYSRGSKANNLYGLITRIQGPTSMSSLLISLNSSSLMVVEVRYLDEKLHVDVDDRSARVNGEIATVNRHIDRLSFHKSGLLNRVSLSVS